MIFREVTQLSIVVRILSAILVGGLIGMERGMKNRPAGLRTYMLVCVGACLIMLTNQYIYQFTGSGDPMRLGAQVVSGIGFLGAGTIVVTRHNQIKGLTTAAGLWASAGVGLALGIGFYEAAITATVGIYIILTVLQRWENRMHKKVRNIEMYIEISASMPLSQFVQNIRTLDLSVEDLQIDGGNLSADNSRAVVMTVKAKKREDRFVFLDAIRNLDGVVYLEEL